MPHQYGKILTSILIQLDHVKANTESILIEPDTADRHCFAAEIQELVDTLHKRVEVELGSLEDSI